MTDSMTLFSEVLPLAKSALDRARLIASAEELDAIAVARPDWGVYRDRLFHIAGRLNRQGNYTASGLVADLASFASDMAQGFPEDVLRRTLIDRAWCMITAHRPDGDMCSPSVPIAAQAKAETERLKAKFLNQYIG